MSASRRAIETIAATIEAFGRGEIALPAVDPKTNAAHVHVLPGGRTYTCQKVYCNRLFVASVARFLGWTKADGNGGVEPTRACRLAFDAYHEPMRRMRGKRRTGGPGLAVRDDRGVIKGSGARQPVAFLAGR